MDPNSTFAGRLRAAGIECAPNRRYRQLLPGARAAGPGNAGYFTADVTIVANNQPVALVRVAASKVQPSWHRVKAYLSLQLPVFAVPAAAADVFAAAWVARDTSKLRQWRVTVGVPAPAVAPF